MAFQQAKFCGFTVVACGLVCIPIVSAMLDSHFAGYYYGIDGSPSTHGYELEIDPIWSEIPKSSMMVSAAVIGYKPSPAVGAFAPSNNSFTSTTGRPFDFFTLSSAGHRS